jgi:hypothetical protein
MFRKIVEMTEQRLAEKPKIISIIETEEFSVIWSFFNKLTKEQAADFKKTATPEILNVLKDKILQDKAQGKLLVPIIHSGFDLVNLITILKGGSYEMIEDLAFKYKQSFDEAPASALKIITRIVDLDAKLAIILLGQLTKEEATSQVVSIGSSAGAERLKPYFAKYLESGVQNAGEIKYTREDEIKLLVAAKASSHTIVNKILELAADRPEKNTIAEIDWFAGIAILFKPDIQVLEQAEVNGIKEFRGESFDQPYAEVLSSLVITNPDFFIYITAGFAETTRIDLFEKVFADNRSHLFHRIVDLPPIAQKIAYNIAPERYREILRSFIKDDKNPNKKYSEYILSPEIPVDRLADWEKAVKENAELEVALEREAMAQEVSEISEEVVEEVVDESDPDKAEEKAPVVKTVEPKAPPAKEGSLAGKEKRADKIEKLKRTGVHQLFRDNESPQNIALALIHNKDVLFLGTGLAAARNEVSTRDAFVKKLYRILPIVFDEDFEKGVAVLKEYSRNGGLEAVSCLERLFKMQKFYDYLKSALHLYSKSYARLFMLVQEIGGQLWTIMDQIVRHGEKSDVKMMKNEVEAIRERKRLADR